VELAVFRACVAHSQSSFKPITPECWWRAPSPFMGSRAAFRRHLRSLERKGYLRRRGGIADEYELTRSVVELGGKL
jgi:hypothetical protein